MFEEAHCDEYIIVTQLDGLLHPRRMFVLPLSWRFAALAGKKARPHRAPHKSLQRLTVAMQVKDTDSGGAEEVPVDVMSSLTLHAHVNLLGAPTCSQRSQDTAVTASTAPT